MQTLNRTNSEPFHSAKESHGRGQIAALSLLATIAVFAGLGWLADDKSFRPITTLASWYTSREHVDVELIATRGVGSEERRVEPKRSLRFRMERAYVSFLIGGAYSPASHLTFLVDMPTGLPASLLQAAPDDRARRSDPTLPAWQSHQDFIERQLSISLSSHELSESVESISTKLDSCRGEPIGSDLLKTATTEDEYCKILALGRRDRYIAFKTDTQRLLISCDLQTRRCEVLFPYAGFAAKASFGEPHLQNWRTIIDKATEFLRKSPFE